MTGWHLRCPVCHQHLLPIDASLHLALAPRLAWHLWDAHPYETRILLLHLAQPPEQWPEIEVAA